MAHQSQDLMLLDLKILSRGVNGSLDDQDLKAAVERALTIDRNSAYESSKAYTWDSVANQFISSLVPLE